MRALSIGLLVVGMLPLSGCLFGSIDPEVRQLDTQIQSISQRVERLEAAQSGGLSASTVGNSALSTSVAAGEGLGSSTANAGRESHFPSFGIPWGKAFDKLARGLTNVVTGWVEVPKRVQETSTQSGPFAGFTWGLSRGVGYGFVRTLGGAYEVVTFPFPAPPDYQPVMRPPYVFTCEDQSTGYGEASK